KSIQKLDFLLVVNEGRWFIGPESFKTAFNGRAREDLEGLDRSCESFCSEGRQLLDVEEAPGEPLRAFRDHDFVGLGEHLKARREMGRIANGRFFSRIYGLALLTNDDEAGRNSNPDLQFSAGAPVHRARCPDDLKGCPYCAFRVVLMRGG